MAYYDDYDYYEHDEITSQMDEDEVEDYYLDIACGALEEHIKQFGSMVADHYKKTNDFSSIETFLEECFDEFRHEMHKGNCEAPRNVFVEHMLPHMEPLNITKEQIESFLGEIE